MPFNASARGSFGVQGRFANKKKYLPQTFVGGSHFVNENTYFTSTDSSLTSLSTTWSGSNQTTYFGGSQTTSLGGRASWSVTLNNGLPMPPGQYGVNIKSMLLLNQASSHDGMFAYAVTSSKKYFLNLSANPPYPTGLEFVRTGLFNLENEEVVKIWITVADGSSAYAMGGRTYYVETFENNLLYSPAPNSYSLVEESGHPNSGDGTLGSYSNGSNWPGRYSTITNNNVIGFRFTSPLPVKYWKVDYSGWVITRLTDLSFQTSTALNRGSSSSYWPDITNSVTSTTTPGTFYIPCINTNTSLTMWLTADNSNTSYIDINSITAYG